MIRPGREKSASAISVEIRKSEVSFDEGAQHDKADLALIAAHQVILYVVDTENTYFKMGLENEIQERFADFMCVWKKERG